MVSLSIFLDFLKTNNLVGVLTDLEKRKETDHESRQKGKTLTNE